MDIALQTWGGVFYLLNKIFLSHAEGIRKNEKWRLHGWIVYLTGLPAWVIILVSKHDWMAAAVEAGGAPAMILGVVVVVKGLEQAPSLLKKISVVFCYGLLFIGITYSLYDFGGITAFSQVLEIGLMSGFLVGTYLLAKKNPNGWFWFMLMNASTGTLMLIQDKPILALQQLISFCFDVHGFIRSCKSE